MCKLLIPLESNMVRLHRHSRTDPGRTNWAELQWICTSSPTLIPTLLPKLRTPSMPCKVLLVETWSGSTLKPPVRGTLTAVPTSLGCKRQFPLPYLCTLEALVFTLLLPSGVQLCAVPLTFLLTPSGMPTTMAILLSRISLRSVDGTDLLSSNTKARLPFAAQALTRTTTSGIDHTSCSWRKNHHEWKEEEIKIHWPSVHWLKEPTLLQTIVD